MPLHQNTRTAVAAGANSTTISAFVVSGTDRALIVKVALKDTTSVVTGVTFNGTEDFAFVGRDRNGDAGAELWELAAPTAITADVVISLDGSERHVSAVSLYTDTHQTNPIRAASVNSNNGTDAAPTVDVVANADEVVVDSLGQVSAGPDSATADHTQRHNTAATGGGTDTRGASQEKSSIGATETMGWTMGDSDNWAIVAGALQEPAGPVTNPGTAAFAGEGTFAAVGARIRAGVAAFSGDGSFAAVGARIRPGVASFSGDGSFAAVGVRIRAGVAAFSGDGTFAADGSAIFSAVATFSGEGTFAGIGAHIVVGGTTFPGVAAFSGDGTFIAIGARIRPGVASFAGDGTFAALGARIRAGVAAFSGDGSFAAVGARIHAATASFAGEGTFAADGARIRAGVAAFSGEGTFAADGTTTRSAAVAFSGEGTFTAVGVFITTVNISERTVFIEAENRSIVIGSEIRTVSIGAENRTVIL